MEKSKKLIPKLWGKKNDLARREESPFFSLQRDMNRLFDDFFGDFSLSPFRSGRDLLGGTIPKLDISETADEVKIEADVPGLDEKDIDVQLADNVLTISGEKKSETEEKKKDYYRMERSYGSFHRSVPIHAEVDPNKVKASLKKDVLTVVLSKTAEAKKNVKKITVQGE